MKTEEGWRRRVVVEEEGVRVKDRESGHRKRVSGRSDWNWDWDWFSDSYLGRRDTHWNSDHTKILVRKKAKDKASCYYLLLAATNKGVCVSVSVSVSVGVGVVFYLQVMYLWPHLMPSR